MTYNPIPQCGCFSLVTVLLVGPLLYTLGLVGGTAGVTGVLLLLILFIMLFYYQEEVTSHYLSFEEHMRGYSTMG